MERGERFPFHGGSVVVYSKRSFDKETPNEDAAVVVPLDETTSVLAVADGVGGQPGGGNASKIVLRALAKAAARSEPTSNGGLRGSLLDALDSGNREVIGLGIGAATTLAAVELVKKRLRAYHVGDSQILVVGQRGKIKLLTIAHSPVGYAVEAGVIDQDEAMHHEERHLVSNIMGAAEMRVEVGSWVTLCDYDPVLLATDGLFDNLSVAEIVETVRKGALDDVGQALATRCAARMAGAGNGTPSKPDDLTFILFRPRSARDPTGAA